MATTYHSGPTGINYIGNPIAFEFSVTGVDDGTTVRRFGYQLCDGNGNPISALESISPKEGKKFVIDFRRDIRPFLSTNVPQCYEFKREEPEMITEIILKYWELVYNKEDCTTEIQNENQVGPYKVLNSADQYWGYANTGSQNSAVLTLKPENVFICKRQCDLLYVWSQNGGTVRMNYYDKEGNLMLGQGSFGGESVYSFLISAQRMAETIASGPSIGPAPNIEDLINRVHKVDVLIDGEQYFTYYFENCCCSRTIWFQQSGGGYSSLGFDCDDFLNVNTSFTEVCRYQPRDSTDGPYDSNVRTRGGLSISNKTSFKTVTLSKDLKRDDLRDLRYYEDFLSSGSYFYEFRSFEGLGNGGFGYDHLVKFIPTAGSIRYYKKEDCYRLVITGKINQPHQMPVYAT